MESPTEEELDTIWQWNATVPEQIQSCVHTLIQDIAHTRPDAPAVCAWDGDYTYAELDRLATETAYRLLEMGCLHGSRIPILFSKSKWACVAMLGVIKMGCAAIALDATQPDERLRSIIRQLKPPIIISSDVHRNRTSSLVDVPVLQLGATKSSIPHLEQNATTTRRPLPKVEPSDLVYISFTSGTTGQPKGACISHANVVSAVRYQGQKLGFHSKSRVFDFAPYSFDVAWSNFLHTLCAGGCLCIASEDDMLKDLGTAISDFKSTLINVTPTVLRTIPRVPKTLETVLLSGEMPYRENITKWAGLTRLLNTYGPTECTFKCAFSVLDPTMDGRPDIGTGVGFATWIVDPLDENRLSPIGAVGELYLEGPLVGQGYLGDVIKTASAFIHNPSWLLKGSRAFTGRQGRLYKTGDLVRYNADGFLMFVGRKADDEQHKIRGQRVELGDVEHHARACIAATLPELPVIADVVRPQDSDADSLALFVATHNQDMEQIRRVMDGLPDLLRKALPAFMVPSVFIPVSQLPLGPTGKVDRRGLRKMGNNRSWQEMMDLQQTILSKTSFEAPSGDMEVALSHIWSMVLSLERTRISRTDSFVRLGGDSISAIRVVASARGIGLSLSVADLFRTPILKSLAQVVSSAIPRPDEAEILPFALLDGSSGTYQSREDAAKLCGVGSDEIEDIYPCTPLQEGMLAESSKAERYVATTAFVLPDQVDLQRLQHAWTVLVKQSSILRTRIVELSGHGLVQVIFRSTPALIPIFESVEEYGIDAHPMGLTTPLCRAGLITTPSHFMLEMHHAIFDGWTTRLILEALESLYCNQQAQISSFSPAQPFVKHVLESNSTKALSYWEKQLKDSEATIFPDPGYNPAPKSLNVSRQISGLQWPRAGVTPSTIVHAALSLLLSSYTASSDIKYGATISGRTAPVRGIERIAMPTIATIPVRVKLDWDWAVQKFLQDVQQLLVDMTEHEQIGLQNIRRISDEVKEASQFELLLVVQPVQEKRESLLGLLGQPKSMLYQDSDRLANGNGERQLDVSTRRTLVDAGTNATGVHNSYAIMLLCQLEPDGLDLSIDFDPNATNEASVQLFAGQLEHWLRQLCATTTETPGEGSKLTDLVNVSEHDTARILEWNRPLSAPVIEPVTSMLEERLISSAERLAISAWNAQLTYDNLKRLSEALSLRLHQKGLRKGSIVVFSLEKSSWMVVGMLAAFRIGAVAVPLSTVTSVQRAQHIVAGISPALVVTSDRESLSSPFRGLVATYTLAELNDLDTGSVGGPDDPRAMVDVTLGPNLSDPALILSTSGSTGVPKWILWSHQNLASNVVAHAASLGIDNSSRVFQFAGYEFDVSTVETLSTLCAGGTLCIPSETDRLNRLAEVIRQSNANWVCLTPSVVDTIKEVEQIPAIQTLVFTGEKLPQRMALKWAEHLSRVYNWYGPAEASVATTSLVEKGTWKAGSIGKAAMGNTAWLVSPREHAKLAAIGAIAELCIEGPSLASYTGGSDGGVALNDAAFFEPRWFLAKENGHPMPSKTPRRRLYRTGDLVKYNSDGSLILLGRKHDAQRKIRGQRIDLEAIETIAQEFLSGKVELDVVAEICTPGNGDTQTLVFFVSIPGKAQANNANVMETDNDATANLIKHFFPAEELEEYLLDHVSSYMVPRILVPLGRIPVTNTGKMDRRALRELGSNLTYEQLDAMQPLRTERARRPLTDMETQLQRLWAETMGIERNTISASHNFFRLGGDSVTAMRLVAAAQRQNISMTVKMVFDAPALETMAQATLAAAVTPNGHWQDAGTVLGDVAPDVPAYSLLNEAIQPQAARSLAAELCNVPDSRIEDIYPCTPLQEGLLALSAKTPGSYISRSVLDLQPEIDIARLESAWSVVVSRMAWLRTRIVDLPGQGFVQVILDTNPLRCCSPDDADVDTVIEDLIKKDEQDLMGPGTDLCRAVITGRNFLLTLHHCTYDGNTLRMLLQDLESQYLGRPGTSVTPFKCFIRHLAATNKDEASAFWKGYLSNTDAVQFPSLPTADHQPLANDEVLHHISLDWPREGITPATIVRSAWAILVTQYTMSDDVTMAITTDGRQVTMSGIDSCVGPTISTMPIVISIDRDESTAAYLSRMQKEMMKRTPYEQYGLHNLRSLLSGFDARLLQTLFVVQPIADERANNLDRDSYLFKARGFAANRDTLGVDPFNNYALQVVCELSTAGMRLRVSFDNHVLDTEQIRRMGRQFETVTRQLCEQGAGERTVGSIRTVSYEDEVAMWAQNDALPRGPRQTIVEMIIGSAREHPNKIAIDAWDGQFTFRQVEELSATMAQNLIRQGVQKGSIVGLHFEKSKWLPVTQLAVFRAGAADVLLSISVPDLRIGRVFANLDVRFAVATDSRVAVVAQYAHTLTVEQLLSTAAQPEGEMTLPALDMSDKAAILVSSGSTGEPKQVLWSHYGIAANVEAHGKFLGVTPSSRIFQFASYDFDVGTIESMSSLAHVACLCIPSEEDRVNAMAATLDKFAATFVNITPSTARAIEPEHVPTIETLVLSGENLMKHDVDRWKIPINSATSASGSKRSPIRVLNWYGAAEHPSTVIAADTDSWYSGVIGSLDSQQPTLSWLVDLKNSDRLVPLGAVGEIASEGPLSSDGYVANPTLQALRFRADPTFLVDGTRHILNTGKNSLSNGSTTNGPSPASKHFGGRRGTIFCSGDLGCYDSHGNLVYMGRKDAQIKIRGQLVAPEEVQQHIRKHLRERMPVAGHGPGTTDDITVVVSAIKLPKTHTTMLVAFLGVATKEKVDEVTEGLLEKLKRALPPYAIPVLYIPVETFPTNASAKIDRLKLSQIGVDYATSMSPAASSSSGERASTNRVPLSTSERALRDLWVRVLGNVQAVDDIHVKDNFLHFGDSVTAMRLAGLARRQGLDLSVAQIFRHPVLEDMAKQLKNVVNREKDDADKAISPYSLMVGSGSGSVFRSGQDAKRVILELRQQAASLCGVDKHTIEDIYPCTPLQEGLLALTMKREGDYVGTTLLQLGSGIDATRLRQAWHKTMASIDILRTRIVNLPERGLVQVVLRSQEEVQEEGCATSHVHVGAGGIREFLTERSDVPMGLGTPLMRYSFFRDGTTLDRSNSESSTAAEYTLTPWHASGSGLSNGALASDSSERHYFALTLHHSIYDGLTVPQILETLEAIYNNTTPVHHQPFRAFIRHLHDQDSQLEKSYWRTQFKDLHVAHFPVLPTSTYHVQTDATLLRVIEDMPWRRDDITPTTTIRGALALLLGGSPTTSLSQTVVFGAVVAGRQISMAGIDRVAGPTIATVPIRINLDTPEVDCTEFLSSLQREATDMIPYEQTGLSRIRRISEEARDACEFQTLLVVQMPEEDEDQQRTGGSLFAGEVRRPGEEHDARYHGFQTYPLSLICTPNKQRSRLHMRICFDSGVLGPDVVQGLADELERLLRRLCSPDLAGVSLGQISSTMSRDMAQISRWNAIDDEALPAVAVDKCVHDLVAEATRSWPDAVAVRGWEGVWTFAELDRASTRLALRLRDLGVPQGLVIPLYFERSTYAIVAMLGVSKAGCASLLLSDAVVLAQPPWWASILPPSEVAGDSSKSLLICSVSKQKSASIVSSNTLVLGPESDIVQDRAGSCDGEGEGEGVLSPVNPASVFQVVPSDGSSGTCRLEALSHRNIASAVISQRSLLKLDHTSLLYDSSQTASGSTAFWGVFHLWNEGGTLCVPSDDELRSNLQGSMVTYGATDAYLQPSVARLLDPAMLPALRNVYLGGDQVTAWDTGHWASHASTTVIYDVVQCVSPALYYRAPDITKADAFHQSPCIIGRGAAVTTWIVDPHNSDQLCAIGTVGELCLGGPLVGFPMFTSPSEGGDDSDGYIEQPTWLPLEDDAPNGHLPAQRTSRVVRRTGDLVKYEPSTGQIFFVGKKDADHLVRGQRANTALVEHHVRQCILDGLAQDDARVIVGTEVVTPDALGKPLLVAFVTVEPAGRESTSKASVFKAMRRAQIMLPERLPAHMIPASLVLIESIPRLSSGKTDRQRLRQLGANLTADELKASTQGDEDSSPTTDAELRLRELWSELLDVSAHEITQDSSFTRLGGDSIYAMRLTALARSKGVILTVGDILQYPKLSRMAAAAHIKTGGKETANGVASVKPFSLLKDCSPAGVQAAVAHVSKQCGVGISQVEDMFPCTGVQKSLLSMTAKSDSMRSNVARYWLDLVPNVDTGRLRQAWNKASRDAAPILRLRIVDVPGQGIIQAQLDEDLPWDEYDSYETYLREEEQQFVGMDTCLTRIAVVQVGQPEVSTSSSSSSSSSSLRCYITQHHAVYDAYSVGLLLEEVSKAYAATSDATQAVHSKSIASVPSLQAFIEHKMKVNQAEVMDFWRQQFQGSEAAPFPALPSRDYRPKADSTRRRRIARADLDWQPGASRSSVIKAAWAILTARYTCSDDVLLGAVVSGRQVPIPGIDRTIAPLISAVPLRIKVDPNSSVAQLVETIQAQSIAMAPFEQTELTEIRRASVEAEVGTGFNTLIVVNPPEQRDQKAMQLGPFVQKPRQRSTRASDDGDLDDFNPNAVMIMCQLGDKQDDFALDLEISFDSHVVPADEMERMVTQFEHILRQVSCAAVAPGEGESHSQNSAVSVAVHDIQAATAEDIAQLWRWNSPLPATVPRCVHHLIGEVMIRQPEAPAISSWDGDLSYAELDRVSSAVARQLASLGAGPGTIVPLVFEKSMWHPVAILGVMRAGAASVAMDATQPESRLRSIIQQISPKIVIASAELQSLASRLSDGAKVVEVSAHSIAVFAEKHDTTTSLLSASAQDTVYVVFTSGSTGVPKGIVVTHQCFSSASIHQQEALRIGPGVRVFDFVSYSFDVSWSNSLQTLIYGGCLCVPSEHERKNDIASAFNRMNCNYSYFTPSVVQALEPAELPGLRTLAMGGEPLPARETARWTHVETIIGIYGPAECTPSTSFTTVKQGVSSNNDVGFACGVAMWLVEPGRPECLAAIGAVGELVLEGPTLSKGYFGDKERTAASYIEAPTWLSKTPPPGHAGRNGRIFVTGDLLRYKMDGSLTFVGRKDGLVKLRGQRIELGEVEHHIRSCIQADAGGLSESWSGRLAAEIISPQNGTSSLLVVFLELNPGNDDNQKQNGREGSTSAPVTLDLSLDKSMMELLSQITQGSDAKLWDTLPQYMVPAAYIPITRMPMTTTNKTDRRALRALGSTLTLETLASLQQSTSQGDEDRPRPSTAMEKTLGTLWAAALDLNQNSIFADSNFFRVGGESITAMSLVAKARAMHLSLTVRDIFKAPRLSEQALLVTEMANGHDKSTQSLAYTPFSLLPAGFGGKCQPEEFLKKFVTPILSSDAGAGTVVDIAPATDFQNLAVTQALQDPPSRYPHWIISLPPDTDFYKLRRACVELVRHFDTLSTIFVADPSEPRVKGNFNLGRYLQVFLEDFNPPYEEIDATADQDIEAFTSTICAQDLADQPRRLGYSFIRFIVVRQPASGKHKLIFRLSHAQFDGFSWPSVLKTLSSIYSNISTAPSQPSIPRATKFIHYMGFNASRRQESIRYWTHRLQGSSYPHWANTDTTDRVYDAKDRLAVHRTVPMPAVQSSRDGDTDTNVSSATLFHAACALVFSRIYGGHDGEVIFGRLVTGRVGLPAELQDVVGPTMTELPIRVNFRGRPPSSAPKTLVMLAAELQAQFLEDTQHEIVGMTEITRECCNPAAWGDTALDFGWRTSYQQPSEEESDEFTFLGQPSQLSAWERDMPPRNRPEVYAIPVGDGTLRFEVEANASLISQEAVDTFLDVLVHIWQGGA